MKRSLPGFLALICLSAILNSFTIANNPAPESTCFIQLNDGSIQHFKTLKLVTGVLVTPHLLADGKQVIQAKDIMAYQNEKHYAVSPKILTSKKNCKVAVETLPGFAVKIISGKLNVYMREYYNGGNTVDEYFLQTGDDGYIVSYTKEMLKSMLKEDVKALEFFNSSVKQSPKTKKLLVAVEMYNNGQLMTKN